MYIEGYTCTCVRKHPVENVFIAQSAAGYIASFESTKPYRLDVHKVETKVKLRAEIRGTSGEWIQNRLFVFGGWENDRVELQLGATRVFRYEIVEGGEEDGRGVEGSDAECGVASAAREHGGGEQLGWFDSNLAVKSGLFVASSGCLLHQIEKLNE